jgi:hypothetical protein
MLFRIIGREVFGTRLRMERAWLRELRSSWRCVELFESKAGLLDGNVIVAVDRF